MEYQREVGVVKAFSAAGIIEEVAILVGVSADEGTSLEELALICLGVINAGTFVAGPVKPEVGVAGIADVVGVDVDISSGSLADTVLVVSARIGTGRSESGLPFAGADGGVIIVSPVSGISVAEAMKKGGLVSSVKAEGVKIAGSIVISSIGCSVAGAEVTGIPVSGAVVTGVPVSGAVVTGVPVSGAVVTGVPLSGAVVTGVSITAAPIPVAEPDGAGLSARIGMLSGRSGGADAGASVIVFGAFVAGASLAGAIVSASALVTGAFVVVIGEVVGTGSSAWIKMLLSGSSIAELVGALDVGAFVTETSDSGAEVAEAEGLRRIGLSLGGTSVSGPSVIVIGELVCGAIESGAIVTGALVANTLEGTAEKSDIGMSLKRFSVAEGGDVAPCSVNIVGAGAIVDIGGLYVKAQSPALSVQQTIFCWFHADQSSVHLDILQQYGPPVP
ncbi:hypothetical protein Plhal710r2_c032g0119501 [Plasmopara halstedii]